MQKFYKTLFLMFIMVCLFIVNINLSNKVNGEEYRNYTIYIDPGHGGIDNGAVSNGAIEKELNLKVSMYLKSYFEQVGINVLMTRETDIDYYGDIRGSKKRSDLQTRIDMINKSNADLFLSIHMNNISSSKWSGSQIFYYPDNVNSEKLAKSVMKNLKDMLKNTTREAKTVKTLFILKNVEKPGVLVEAGFLSNPQESSLLKDSSYQEKLAYAIFIGVLEYLDSKQ
ncbi:MAG: N-acetylmuramoyl-L-alanine amidase CwlD [Haloplasmataceae bacterium]|jgi:N-acetylmuramoyl-L-alanine amidase|nr:N-acetylmuramoyl-L-alanine amidase CwlD [Haloplasmataceae bacterium]